MSRRTSVEISPDLEELIRAQVQYHEDESGIYDETIPEFLEWLVNRELVRVTEAERGAAILEAFEEWKAETSN